MNPLFAHLALDWLDAERKANPAEWPLERLTKIKDEMTVAVDRVYQVISGNVRWDDASPGDKAIWKSRVSDMSAFSRTWNRDGTVEPTDALEEASASAEPFRKGRLPGRDTFGETDPIDNERLNHPRTGRGPRLHGIRERRWWVWYDTVSLDHRGPEKSWSPSVARGSYRLFGNANIGNVFLTNMQVAGQFASDQSFVITNVFVSVGTLEALHWAADNVMFTLVVGDRPMLPQLYLRDMFRGVCLDEKGRRVIVVPVRQNLSVVVDLRRPVPDDLPPCDLTYHIEGLQTRDIQ